MDPIEIIKQGETCISVAFQRSQGGLTISVHAIPPIEEFMSILAEGETKEVKTFGRYWSPIGKEGKPLMSYQTFTKMEPIYANTRDVFVFDKCGAPIMEVVNSMGGTPTYQVNMSFLRLVGISEGPGVSFGVKGVYTMEAVRTMRARIAEGARLFYVTYLQPIHLTASVITQDLVTARKET